MSPRREPPRPGWDAAGYDARFGFVTAHGRPLLDLLEPQPGMRILDLGCGTGHQAAELARHGCTVIGVDIDAAMLERARASHPDVAGLTFVQADAQEPGLALLPVVADLVPFDVVMSNAALHWMPYVRPVLANVRSLLDVGGRFIAEQGGIGNVHRCLSAVQAALAEHVDPRIAHDVVFGSSWFPSPGREATLLEASGFAVRRLELSDRPTQLAAGDSIADWATMFRPQAMALAPSRAAPGLRAAVDAAAEALGLRNPDGSWWADYVRLRFVAEAVRV